MRMLIKNGRVIDPASNTDDIRDILVEDGVIAEVAKDIDKAADTVIDAKGCMVMPGLVDLHVHFREPGFEHKETIRTGARAAARGGFTTVCPMPNTKPAIDSVEMVEYIKNKSEEVTDINILPIAAMTAGQDGEYITDYERLYEEGAVAVSEDGKSVMNARVARQAMRLAAEVGIPVFAHCEDKDLAARGVMNAVKEVHIRKAVEQGSGKRIQLEHHKTNDPGNQEQKANVFITPFFERSAGHCLGSRCAHKGNLLVT